MNCFLGDNCRACRLSSELMCMASAGKCWKISAIIIGGTQKRAIPPPPEPCRRRREEACSLLSEAGRILLTSAPTVQGFKAQNLVWGMLPLYCSRCFSFALKSPLAYLACLAAAFQLSAFEVSALCWPLPSVLRPASQTVVGVAEDFFEPGPDPRQTLD